MLLEDERGTVNLIVPPPVYDRHRAEVRASPLVRAKGTLERREGTTNVVVSEVRELERTAPPGAPRADGPAERPAEPSLTAAAYAKARRIARECEARRRAVAQLRAVTPAGHSFGRRGERRPGPAALS
jgi:error-prone DNA polymerase